MDPVTIFQIVGTAVSLGDIVVKCITRLSSLKSKYHDAPIHISTMIGQLYIVQTALDQLSVWNRAENDRNPRFQQLATQIGDSVDSFGVLILALQRHLDQFESPDSSGMVAKSRFQFLWSEKEISEYSILLDRQVSALSLLLQAIQCQTWMQQQSFMDREESQSVLMRAKDCSSSIFGLDDTSSSIFGPDDTHSAISETTANISVMFDFDTLILASKIYQQAERSHLRQAIRARDQPDVPHEEGNTHKKEGDDRKEEGRQNRTAAAAAASSNLTHRRIVVTNDQEELQALNERCAYLRKTYKGLRAGRQKLHDRMISYLKRGQTTIFSRESLLKQEEALQELDISIDQFIDTLEKGENRRLELLLGCCPTHEVDSGDDTNTIVATKDEVSPTVHDSVDERPSDHSTGSESVAPTDIPGLRGIVAPDALPIVHPRLADNASLTGEVACTPLATYGLGRSSGAWSLPPAAGSALLTSSRAPQHEDDVWNEYDDLINEMLPHQLSLEKRAMDPETYAILNSNVKSNA